MPRHADIDQVIDAIYGTVSDARRWDDALRSISACLGNAGACVFLTDQACQHFPLWCGIGLGEGQAEYRAHYARLDPRAKFAAANPQSRVHYDYMLIDERGMDRDPFYDFQSRTTDAYRYFLGCRFNVDAEHTGYLALHWPRRMGHVRPEQIRAFTRLAPHIERALQIGQRIAAAELRGAVADAAIDRVPQALFVLDAAGRALLLNRAAEALVRDDDGLTLSEGRLTARQIDDDAAIGRLIAGAAARTQPRGGVHGIARPSRRRAYTVFVAPLPVATPQLGRAFPAVIVLVVDPERRAALPAELLMRLYGLTPAEAELAVRLAAGMTVQQSAGDLDIAVNTARVHLQHVLSKTGTHRQGELLRLLLALAPVSGPAEPGG